MKQTGSVIAVLGVFLFAQSALADWTPVKRLTWTSGMSFGPAGAIDSTDAIHVVWYDTTPGNYAVYYRRSTDGGATWSALKRLTWASGDAVCPSIAADSNDDLHLVWQDATSGNDEIYYRKSTDAGASWSAAKRLTWTSGNSWEPLLAIDSANAIHVVWYDDTPGNLEVYYRGSADGGETWGSTKRLTWNSSRSESPVIAIDGADAVHVAWYDNMPGHGEIYYKRSTDGGTTWSSMRRLTWLSYCAFPSIAADSGTSVHLAWAVEAAAGMEIYYKRSTDSGATWSASKRLVGNPGGSSAPALAVASMDNPHIVWMDYSPNDPEIYYKKSADGGSTWGADKRLTWSEGNSYDPALAIDSAGFVHVFWRDDIATNIEVYYRKGKE